MSDSNPNSDHEPTQGKLAAGEDGALPTQVPAPVNELGPEQPTQVPLLAQHEDGPTHVPVGVKVVDGTLKDPLAPSGEPDFAQKVVDYSKHRGTAVGNLELTDRLGIGAMGSVYKALHRTLRTPYAVKVLHPQFSADQEAIERFRLEAVACSRLRHENIVFVTDFGFEEGLGLYICMEFLEGRSLGSILRRGGALGLGRTVRIGQQIASAMAAAHRLGIVHRDLKPDNVMVLEDPSRRDFTKVLDFGIAKIRDSDGRDLTAKGSAVGTPRYMAPEQLMDSKRVGPPTDIYALGCILYALLSGQPPFTEGTDFEILTNQVSAPPQPLSTKVPHLAGSRLEALVMQMLAKDMDARPEDMGEVLDRLVEAQVAAVEAGLPGAEYEVGLPVSSIPRMPEPSSGPLSVHPLRMSQVIDRIRDVAPESPSAALLAALPSVGALQGEVLCLALWGIIQQDLIDAEVDSTRFGQTTDQLLLLMQAVLESNAGVRPSQTQSRIYRSLRNLLDLLPRERKRTIVRGLRPLAAADSFPLDLLPGENTGSWSAVKSVLTREITLSGLTRRRAVDPAREAEQKRREEELGEMSLGEKLRQDVSLASIRAVLGHEISLFGQDGAHGVPVLESPELDDEAEDQDGLQDSQDEEPPVHLDELESGS